MQAVCITSLILSLTFLSVAITCGFWGKLADCMGEKKSLMISGVSSILTTSAFGFSYNLISASIIRFVHGLSSELPAILKTLRFVSQMM